MSKYTVDHAALTSLDRQSLREFDEEIARSIERDIQRKRMEEEEAVSYTHLRAHET